MATTQKFSNDASSLLAVSIGTGDLTVQVAAGEGALFPSIGANEFVMLAIENAAGDIEFVKATARSTDTFTVVRAQEGTTARAFTASQARVELRLSKGTMERFLQHDSGVLNQDLTIPNLTISATFTLPGGVTNWHSGNDGSLSGLDADLLDGLHAASFVLASAYTAADVLAKIKTVDGAASGLDADLLDGLNADNAATPSTIAARTSAGYLYAEYFNQESAEDENPSTVSQVFVQSGADGFLRKASLTHFKRKLFLNCTIQADPGGTPSGTPGDVFLYY